MFFCPKYLATYRDALVQPKKRSVERKAYDKKVPRGFDDDLLRHNALYFGSITKMPK